MFKRISIVVTCVCFSAIALAAPPTAAKKSVQVAQLNAETVQAIRRAVESSPIDIRALNTAIPNFKVPAITKQSLICEVTRTNVLVCFEQNEAEKCPTTVDLKVPGLEYPVAVGVTCEPNTPDMNGQCECELSN